MWWACGCGRGGALLVYWGALAGPLPATHFWEGGSEGFPGCRDQIAVAGAWNTRCALVYLLHSCSVTWPGACAVYWWRVPPALPMQGREASAGAARQQCAGGGLWARRGAQVRTKQTAAGAQPCQRAAHCVSWMGACPSRWAPLHPGGACAAAYTAGRSAASWQRFTGGDVLVGQRLLPFGGLGKRLLPALWRGWPVAAPGPLHLLPPCCTRPVPQGRRRGLHNPAAAHSQIPTRPTTHTPPHPSPAGPATCTTSQRWPLGARCLACPASARGLAPAPSGTGACGSPRGWRHKVRGMEGGACGGGGGWVAGCVAHCAAGATRCVVCACVCVFFLERRRGGGQEHQLQRPSCKMYGPAGPLSSAPKPTPSMCKKAEDKT